jgi:hypothetical protein
MVAVMIESEREARNEMQRRHLWITRAVEQNELVIYMWGKDRLGEFNRVEHKLYCYPEHKNAAPIFPTDAELMWLCKIFRVWDIIIKGGNDEKNVSDEG